MAELVEALRYKPEGRGFDSRWCHWNFSSTYSFRPHYGPVVNSASNRNDYHEYFLVGKSGRCVGLTTLPPSCADCLEIWEPQPLGTLWASTGLQWDYLLTPWCIVLEQLTGLQLVKKFPVFHGTRRFITALTSVRHVSLSWASPIQFIYPHPTSWRYVQILSTHLRLGLPSGLFPIGFHTKTLYTPPLLTHMRHIPSPSHASRFYHPHNVGRGVQII